MRTVQQYVSEVEEGEVELLDLPYSCLSTFFLYTQFTPFRLVKQVNAHEIALCVLLPPLHFLDMQQNYRLFNEH